MNEPCFYTVEQGSYFFQSSVDFSAYQGWCVFSEAPWDLFKVVDLISQDFSVLFSGKTLFLERNYSSDFFIDLDFRFIHDFDSKGRIYEVYEKNGLLVVKYTKFFDDSLSEPVFSRFLSIKVLGSFELLKQWVKKFYPYDAKRNSLSELFVFRLLRSSSKNLVLGFGFTEEEAVVNSLAKPVVKDEHNVLVEEQSQKKLFDEQKEALLAVDNAFSSCVKRNNEQDFMIFAGYPWFFQVWGRDECISLVGLFVQKKFGVAKNIILRSLKSLKEGILPNRFPHSVLGSADATGWLFHRISLFLKLSKNEDFGFSSKELFLVEEKLDEFIVRCRSRSSNGLVMNGPKETWMDTSINSSDSREGARVEIQALFLSALELKKFLRKLAGDNDQVIKYNNKIRNHKTLIRKQLVKDKILHDGFNDGLDFSVRPNVFLAYYIYPGLVMKHQWSATFDHVLKNCWLEWGGLSSIDKNHDLFVDTYSGMDNRSYHRGDSWFFINNIVALVLNSFDKKKFAREIKKIKDASIKELLYSGFRGYCAEVSSAKQLESGGCLNQAWSNATLLELLVKTK